MLDDYFKVIKDGIEVTDNFDFSIIHQSVLIAKECVSRKPKALFHSGNQMIYKQMVYIYSFIYNDEYYILVLDEVILPDPSDEWEGHFWNITTFDTMYIDMCKNKRVFKFDWTWFLIEENSDEFCEIEMSEIRPLIRKAKIKKILNEI